MAEETNHWVFHEDAHMKWKIKRFLYLAKEDNYCVTSPTFSLSLSKWCLLVYPNGQLSRNSAGWIVLHLKKDETAEKCRVAFEIGINKEDGSKFVTRKFKRTFNTRVRIQCSMLIERSKLTAAEGIFDADGSLRFFCTARIVNTKETNKEESHTTFPYANQTLVEDLNRLYLEGRDVDFTVKVGNKYLYVHKCILATRSNVFADKISRSLAENSNEIKIDDYDPDAFQAFILYLYTGIFDAVSSDNALILYEIAKEYNVKELKEECVRCMMRELSVDSFCDVMHLAVKHDESHLLEVANNFFYQHTHQILETPKWTVFSSKETVIAEKLLSAFGKSLRRQLDVLQAKYKMNSGRSM